MRVRQFAWFAFGVLLAVAGVAVAQGGYPTITRFLRIGINTAPPAASGQIAISGTGTGSSSPRVDILSTAASSNPELRLRRNAGTTSDWELYLPTGSTDFRFFTGGGDAYTFGATGNLQLTQLNGVAPSDFARLSQQNTFTGQIQGLAAASPLLNINDTSGADKSLVRFQDNGVTRGYVGSANVASGCIVGDAQGDVCVRAVSGAVRVSGDDGATTHFAVSSTAITGTSGVDMTPSSGTFTVNYDNCCTTTITQSVRWYKIGSVVTMTAAAATSGTGDTTVFDSTVDIPAAIRPSTSNAYSAGFGANNNGASVTAMVEIATNGEIIVNRCGAVTGTCDGGAWTGSGARGLDAWTVSYVQ